MRTLDTDADLRAAVETLLRVEPRFAAVIENHGHPPLRRMHGGLAGLLRIVTDQMISLRAGEAIWARLERELRPFDAGSIARRREASLVRLGLSGAKARTFRHAAKAVASGALDFDNLHQMPDEIAWAALTALPGVGPWTADIYLLSAMGRADAWPAGDLALLAAAQHLFGLTRRPDAKALAALAESWRPFRSVGARLLWSHYRGLRGLAQTVT
ncbi:MAG: DNA-3-methyladenine glycosylase family protein [Hyphomicrobiales bacterium]